MRKLQDVQNKLISLDVGAYTENKKGLTYLSWSNAWEECIKIYSDATYEIKKNEQGLPYFGEPTVGYMVYTTITIEGVTREMWLPVMDYNNRAMQSQPHKYKMGKNEKSCEAMTMFDVNKAVMRCLTKNLAMFGLGLYIYKGEDFPTPPPKTDAEIEKEEKVRVELMERLKKQNKEEMGSLGVKESQIIKRFKCTIDEMNLEKLEALALEFKITRSNRKLQS